MRYFVKKLTEVIPKTKTRCWPYLQLREYIYRNDSPSSPNGESEALSVTANHSRRQLILVQIMACNGGRRKRCHVTREGKEVSSGCCFTWQVPAGAGQATCSATEAELTQREVSQRQALPHLNLQRSRVPTRSSCWVAPGSPPGTCPWSK
jgi:hypothetical protein